MSTINVALLGYGTVGKGVYEIIKSNEEHIYNLLGRKVKIVAVLVKHLDKHNFLKEDILFTDQYEDILRLSKLDVVIEATVGKEPSSTYLKKAIERKCHIITANKEMFAYHGLHLEQLAEQYGVTVGYEATVAGGIPIIQTLRKLLNLNRVIKIEGILNGTSNFILSKMREENLSFETALIIAQEQGYAESDPTNDIEGLDAFYKLMILSQVCFNEQPDWNQVYREGITSISNEKIKNYAFTNHRVKHVATLNRTENGIEASVKPIVVSASHPFYNVEGVQNAISIEANIVGTISLSGPGAGMFPTASAIVEDLIHAFQPHLIQNKHTDRFSHIV